ncbi:MAG: antitoxin VapB [Caballeronia sp.]|jgi:antitoxin VapB|nr:antitoxin VapB [Caballeronia sp.]
MTNRYVTKTFRIGNSRAVRIPDELAYDRAGLEVEIERAGDELIIRPVRRSLAGVLEKFARFAPDFTVDTSDEHEQADRKVCRT